MAAPAISLTRACALALLLLAAGAARADAPPPVPGMEILADNGHAFSLESMRLPLRCLDAPGLLGRPQAEILRSLDRAAAAGFNAVSFECPLFGARGLSRTLGQVDADAARTFTRTLEACEARRLYAFPVLHPQSSVDGLLGTATARALFFSGRNALGWQAWALRQAAALTVKGRPLTRCPAVGGWLLYRGPWPGGTPLGSGAAADALTVSAQEGARLRAWATWTVKVARKLGFKQELGLGLMPKGDLNAGDAQPGPVLDASAGGAPPVAALSEVSFSAGALSQESKQLDVLPPVPGADAEQVDDSGAVPAPPASPWDLEGLDWSAVDGLLSALPVATQLNFVEFTLDTEDWYRVGGRLAEAAAKAEVPVLWRQDWRSASRYERGKRLAAPSPMAGIQGPWPDDDWPTDGDTLWPLNEAPSPDTAPFAVRGIAFSRKGGKLVLDVQLTRAAQITADWGRALPLEHESVAGSLDPAKARPLLHVPLEGVAKGAWFLLKIRGESPRFGSCVLRTRWVRAPQ